jgi:hypothetical protein
MFLRFPAWLRNAVTDVGVTEVNPLRRASRARSTLDCRRNVCRESGRGRPSLLLGLESPVGECVLARPVMVALTLLKDGDSRA